MPSSKQVYIAVIGAGGVGKAFLSQLEALSLRFISQPSPPVLISVVYLSRSTKAVQRDFSNPIELLEWSSALEASSSPPLSPADLARLLLSAPKPSHAIVVDNTSNQHVADSYPVFLSQGISVCTPNKKAFSGSLELWDKIFSVAGNSVGDKGLGFIFHESSVGAGLPVISTLKELLDTGDVVTRIEGVFSGTMSYLFNSFMPVNGKGGGKFSDEVKKAKELGFTEPDPRDDLNGLDVARKLVILARLVGLKIKDASSSFPVQSLIPKELENVQSGEEFVERLGEFDDQIEGVKKEAEGEGKVLRYVGSIDVASGNVEVGLQKFDTSHPIAALKGSDNIINFYTQRYGSNPLIIQGAGAGADVTAMGVTGDLIKVFNLIQ